MAINLDSFRQAARIGGRITLDQQRPGSLESSGRGLGGRLVAWLKDTFGGDPVRAQNREAASTFLGALRREFGPTLGDMAARQLADEVRGGRPLTARSITTALDQLDRSRQQIAGLNTGFAVRFAQADDAGSPMSFGRVLDDVSRAMGAGIRLDQVDAGRLADTRRAIERGIRSAGENGGRLVDEAEAHGIATREVKKLITLEARARLVDELITPGDSTSAFDRAFASACEARGTDLPQDSFALANLRQTLISGLVAATYNPGEDAHTRPLGREQAQAIVERGIGQYLDGKKILLDKADELAGGNEAHRTLLRDLVTGAEKLKPAELERVWSLRRTVGAVLTAFADPGQDLAARLGSLQGLSNAVTHAQAELRLDADGVNRIMEKLVQVTLATAGLDEPTLGAIRAAMSRPDFDALREVLILPMADPELMPRLGDAGREMIGLASVINVLTDGLGVDAGPLLGLGKVEDVPAPVIAALRAQGIDLLQ